ncbi:hypothetical protein [Dictyobacter kobayashii]|uniref:Uncharacterized protein n=1 Tax=Dictyobacter kobayashii TaxID=2014872 RepID=A0A402ARN0_9CHLR|nr:hypothetical protein [Dictyobacter kobayashii]GCE21749.1 hypothetical protein KDK_55490 [Dictyobacter kobayashii]
MSRNLFPSRTRTLPRLALPFLLACMMLVASVSVASAKTNDTIDGQPQNWHPVSQVSQSLIQNSQPAPDTTSATPAKAATTNAAKASAKNQIKTIPYWTSSFNYQGQNYPYSMVGKDPSKGSSLTIVPTILIPIKITLSDGVVYDGSTKADAVAKSPLFQFAQYESGYTQYGDAIQRAEFWTSVSKSLFYHVWLTPPVRYPTLSLNVPADQGQELHLRTGKVAAGVDINYLDAQLVAYMQNYHISTRVLPIFISYNTLGTDQGGCCIGGYHNAIPNADNTAIQTYAYAEYGDTGLLRTTNPNLFANTDALSHEIAEWYNDPFTNNIVPDWSVPSEPQYGCSNILEVGDPLVGVGFDVNGYHLQDEVFFSFFARQQPSIAIDGKYTYLGTFTTYAGPC